MVKPSSLPSAVNPQNVIGDPKDQEFSRKPASPNRHKDWSETRAPENKGKTKDTSDEASSKAP